MKSINVLSLFDGCSCARVALERANISINKYYASEIDKYAIKISQKNYPDIIQLGDINNWINWNINWKTIDLLIAGFPCQSWSIAGKGLGDKDPRGQLLWVMMDIFNHITLLNPNIKFLFENVRPKKKHLNYINNIIGAEPILINSALVAAQNRLRCYWTNIKGITQPEDKKIYLKDIIESGEFDRDKSYCIDAKYFKGGSLKNYLEKSRRQVVLKQSEKRLMVKTIGHGYIKENIQEKDKYPTLCGQDPSSKHLLQIGKIGKGGQGQRIYSIEAKSVTLSALGGGQGAKTGLYLTNYDDIIVRKLTPVECERLQTLSDGYTDGVSNSQRYKMLGNGFTVDVITHILSFIKI